MNPFRNSLIKSCINPASVGSGLTGNIIDRKGYNGLEFIVSYGNITATDAKIHVAVLEGHTIDTLTSAADADLQGTEIQASMLQASPRTTTAGNTLVAKRIGYSGEKRYVTLKVEPSLTPETLISAAAILHSPAISL